MYPPRNPAFGCYPQRSEGKPTEKQNNPFCVDLVLVCVCVCVCVCVFVLFFLGGGSDFMTHTCCLLALANF